MTRRRFATLSAVAPAALALDPAAPKFKGKSLDGEAFDNASLKGKVVLIQLWTTWCGYCRRDQPAVDELFEEFRESGLAVLAVNVGESRKKVKKYLDENPRAVRVVLMEDTNLAAVFGGNAGFPKYVVLDREGRVAREQEGSGGEPALRRLLAAAGITAAEK